MHDENPELSHGPWDRVDVIRDPAPKPRLSPYQGPPPRSVASVRREHIPKPTPTHPSSWSLKQGVIPALFGGLLSGTSFMGGHTLAPFAIVGDGPTLARVGLVAFVLISLALVVIGTILHNDGSKTAPQQSRVLGVLFVLLGCGFILGATSAV